jgi:16S rRNA (uracil1498-N3)-methyltransferase
MHNRFFCPKANITNKIALITDKKEIHHIVDVLRFGLGSKILIFDGEGVEIEGEIKNITKEKIDIFILKKTQREKNSFNITLACAIPKKSKFDLIVEKATELGVDRIIPLITQRTEVSFSKERAMSKLNHWRQIAINASKQSQRVFIPELREVTVFKEIVSEIRHYDLAVLLTLQGDRITITDALETFYGDNILVFIGPEGDFSENEIKLALNLGCKPITLGERVLKIDTAMTSIIAIINNILESRE